MMFRVGDIVIWKERDFAFHEGIVVTTKSTQYQNDYPVAVELILNRNRSSIIHFTFDGRRIKSADIVLKRKILTKLEKALL